MTDLGSVLGVISAVAVPASLGVQYLRGKWPFTPNDDNVYLITQYLTGHKGPALKPNRPGFFPFPILKFVKDKDENPVKVPGIVRDVDSKFHFRTNDNFEGDQNIQYTYVIPDDKCAKKFYWKTKQNRGIIDEVVHSKIAKEVGKRNADDLPKEEEAYLDRLVLEDIGKKSFDNYLYSEYGVIITKISSSTPDFVPDAQRILSRVPEAERKAQEEIINAKATSEIVRTLYATAEETVKLTGMRPGNVGYKQACLDQFNIYYKMETLQKFDGSSKTHGGDSLSHH